MKKDEVLYKLRSSSPDERYEAAKFLAGEQIPMLESELNISFEKESVGYIKKTLSIAITRLKSSVPNQTEPDQILQSKDQSSFINGMNEMASVFLHELEPVVGRIAYTARKEITSFDESETSRHIEKLRSIIQAITELRQVHKSKNTEEINIESYLSRLIDSEFLDEANSITLSGNKNVNCVCDGNLLGLAVINGIRNSLEACSGYQSKPSLVIRWGETNVDWYICVVDNGIGLSIPVDELKKRSVSTKINHLGYGLLIINNAMERIDGHWTLENDAAEGANLTLRWNK
ncbi:hypothetical protein A6J71_21995 [Enterobacter cancerogenus]|uniref:ATP-binding protein n=1 Tax=Enterobacter cancerogenus TaxID=69218 RepID=UPI000C9C8506|nr:ATP-binding protein [Enterobacter cancerogenus]PNF12660.1 hypothetical protein A6J71_21995 [Enterobacter cancerogenus]